MALTVANVEGKQGSGLDFSALSGERELVEQIQDPSKVDAMSVSRAGDQSKIKINPGTDAAIEEVSIGPELKTKDDYKDDSFSWLALLATVVETIILAITPFGHTIAFFVRLIDIAMIALGPDEVQPEDYLKLLISFVGFASDMFTMGQGGVPMMGLYAALGILGVNVVTNKHEFFGWDFNMGNPVTAGIKQSTGQDLGIFDKNKMKNTSAGSANSTGQTPPPVIEKIAVPNLGLA